MYEELINSLRYCATHSCMGEAPALTGCTAIYDDAPKDCDSCNAVLQWQAADAIEDLEGKHFMIKKTAEWLAEKVPKWIPVTERLPDMFKHVLVNIPGMTPHPTVQEAFLEKNGMWYSNGFRYLAEEITHWMPLPPPPAVDTEEQP